MCNILYRTLVSSTKDVAITVSDSDFSDSDGEIESSGEELEGHEGEQTGDNIDSLSESSSELEDAASICSLTSRWVNILKYITDIRTQPCTYSNK